MHGCNNRASGLFVEALVIAVTVLRQFPEKPRLRLSFSDTSGLQFTYVRGQFSRSFYLSCNIMQVWALVSAGLAHWFTLAIKAIRKYARRWWWRRRQGVLGAAELPSLRLGDDAAVPDDPLFPSLFHARARACICSTGAAGLLHVVFLLSTRKGTPVKQLNP